MYSIEDIIEEIEDIYEAMVDKLLQSDKNYHELLRSWFGMVRK